MRGNNHSLVQTMASAHATVYNIIYMICSLQDNNGCLITGFMYSISDERGVGNPMNETGSAIDSYVFYN